MAKMGTGRLQIEISTMFFFLSLGAITPWWVLASSFTRLVFLDHTQRHTTIGRTPLDE
jgi:uncharacterized membrane protein YqjE